MHDFHVHSNYSDGRFLSDMIRAAERAGLDGVGFADHCNVSSREFGRETRVSQGYNLDATYERRRRGVERLRDGTRVEYIHRGRDGLPPA